VILPDHGQVFSIWRAQNGIVHVAIGEMECGNWLSESVVEFGTIAEWQFAAQRF
jgi:hypothetical protein